MEKVVWGVLGASNFAKNRTIPAMLQSEHCRIEAIASRSLEKAQEQADRFGIPRAYGSYDQLLADPAIEAVYIPLANHLHVPWTIKAAEAGKHVLCEKPIAMNAAEAETLLDVRERTGKLIMEAFMVRSHPQWLHARELVRQGRIGDVLAVQTFVGYNNVDREDIRNRREVGGGGMMDIGCYAITTTRFILEREPERVMATIGRDPEFGTDRLCTVMMDFPGVQASFICGTQIQPSQRATIHGTAGSLEVEMVIIPSPDRPARISIREGSPVDQVKSETVTFDPVNQYTIQTDLFCRAIREGIPQTLSLENSIANMRVIDAAFRSGESGQWERV